MKITDRLIKFARTHRLSTLALTAAACAGMITGCATTDSAGNAGVFKFTVFHYKAPVDINTWTYDAARNEGPEGASLNVATLITHGDVDQWLARWNNTDRPNLSPADRASLAEKWASLKDGHLCVLNRIVSGATVIVEISVLTKEQKTQKLQVPMEHVNGEWQLTSVDPSSDFLNWEASNNKIVNELDPKPLAAYLNQIARPAQAASL